LGPRGQIFQAGVNSGGRFVSLGRSGPVTEEAQTKGRRWAFGGPEFIGGLPEIFQSSRRPRPTCPFHYPACGKPQISLTSRRLTNCVVCPPPELGGYRKREGKKRGGGGVVGRAGTGRETRLGPPPRGGPVGDRPGGSTCGGQVGGGGPWGIWRAGPAGWGAQVSASGQCRALLPGARGGGRAQGSCKTNQGGGGRAGGWGGSKPAIGASPDWGGGGRIRGTAATSGFFGKKPPCTGAVDKPAKKLCYPVM